MSDDRTDPKKVKARVDVANVLEALGARFDIETGGWDDEDRFYCPFCADLGSNKPAGRANSLTGLWFCFACGSGGDIFTAVKLARGVDFNEALQWVLDKWPEQEVDFDPWATEETP